MMKRSRNGNGKQSNGNASLRKSQPARLQTVSNGARSVRGRARPVLITGGAGFIGTNVADHLLSAGQPVILLDNLSRPGVERNLAWLRETHGDLVQVEVADIQDFERVRQVVQGVAKVFHFAAQVAVTTSLDCPFHDFEVNARGTLNLLEALRELSDPPPLIFTSTNKVYGDLHDIRLRATDSRYEPEDEALRTRGFNEARPLDFHSPYGCSKGAAEQYVLDYARTFDLPAVVFRMSCIYGPHQFGTEDQGWVAHFLIRALEGKPITLYGDGKQVRDILFVEDLVGAFLRAHECMAAVSGQAFNIGGGATHTVSLLELVDLITEFQGARPLTRFDDWRPADQQYYVSDTGKFRAQTGWRSQTSVRVGVKRLWDWLRECRSRPPVPVVLPAPASQEGGFTDGETAAKLGASSAAAAEREPRSKRIWKLATAPAPALENKIIKFP